jgi:hypothetical protein
MESMFSALPDPRSLCFPAPDPQTILGDRNAPKDMSEYTYTPKSVGLSYVARSSYLSSCRYQMPIQALSGRGCEGGPRRKRIGGRRTWITEFGKTSIFVQ